MAPHIYLQFLVPNGFHAVHAFPLASMQPYGFPSHSRQRWVMDDHQYATELGKKRSWFLVTPKGSSSGSFGNCQMTFCPAGQPISSIKINQNLLNQNHGNLLEKWTLPTPVPVPLCKNATPSMKSCGARRYPDRSSLNRNSCFQGTLPQR